jgi:TolA-binding protein
MTLPGSVTEPESSETGVSRRPSFRYWPLLRRAGWGVLAGGVVTSLVFSLLSIAKLDRLDGQLSALAQRQSSMQQDERLTGMQSELSTLRQQQAEEDRQLAELRQKLDAVVIRAGNLPEIDTEAVTRQAELLKQLSAGQEGLKARVSTLESQLASRPTAAVAKSAGVSKAAAGTGKSKPAASRSRPSRTAGKPAVARAMSVPFVLTGTERRGAQSLAAIAPKGYSSLSQVALIGEGEAVAGWTLVHAGYGQAAFRVNGRTVLVNAQ